MDNDEITVLTVRLPNSIIKRIDEQLTTEEKRSHFIRNAIREKLERELQTKELAVKR
jgi:metal-responsive CopG/Arc/MetJ family transcriptional regulator